jgi:hypothetical protein
MFVINHHVDLTAKESLPWNDLVGHFETRHSSVVCVLFIGFGQQ